MSGYQTEIEKLTAEKAALERRIEALEKVLAQREYHQGLKERPFWVRSPSFWFSIAESEFKVAGVIDDHIKYNYVVSQLDEETTEIVKDIINNPPVKGKYVKLKEELRCRLGEPEHVRMWKLFEEKLKEKTPSQFYRHLQWLAETNVTVDKILLHLWLRRLPQHCQEILASRLEEPNSKLAELADNILDATKASENFILHDTIVDNDKEQNVDEVGKQAGALEVSVKRQHSRNQSGCVGRLGSTNTTPTTTPKMRICWYHKRWGPDSHRCIPPCNWKQDEQIKN